MSGLEPGFQLGHYRIIRSLGSGGMADVYEAHDEHLERTVALKILPIEYCRNPQLVQRFQKEVRAAARLNHRNIVTVFEVGQQDSWHFFSMRLLTGGDLRKRIEEGLTPVESLAILREVADAFSHAHARGFVHRDVKPENIMFDEQGFPVLTDFGIAKALDANTHMTRTGMTMGTPRYLSPEQASGKPVDARADLYSLGVILHEMLTGRPPYDAEEAMAVIFKHVTEPIPVLPPDFARYQALLEKLMAKDPNQRVASAADLIKEIDAIVPRQATAELKQSQLRTAENPLIARLMTPSPLRTPPPKTPRPATPPPLTPAPATPVIRDMTGEVIVRAPPVTNRGPAVRPATPVAPARAQPELRPAAVAVPPEPAAAPAARSRAPLLVGGALAAAALAAVAFFALRPTTPPATVAAPVTAPAPAVDAQAEAERARRDAEQKQAAERHARQQAEADARKRAEQEAARTKAAEDLQARQQAEAEAQRRAAIEAEARRREQTEADARRRAEAETEARKRAEAQAEAKRREQAEAEARKRAAEDAARRQAVDEESLSAAEIERRAREADRAKAAARKQKAGEPQAETKAAKKEAPASTEEAAKEEAEAEALERARRPTGF